MDKATALKYLIIGILTYYLVKGILFLLMWQSLVKMEERGKERIAKKKKALEEMRQKRSTPES
ncbi:MAG: hypothetical protein PHZ03_03095 [Syntrophomonas sp.]|nr:hypothetical protein [Syntrophomonas sp.]